MNFDELVKFLYHRVTDYGNSNVPRCFKSWHGSHECKRQIFLTHSIGGYIMSVYKYLTNLLVDVGIEIMWVACHFISDEGGNGVGVG